MEMVTFEQRLERSEGMNSAVVLGRSVLMSANTIWGGD